MRNIKYIIYTFTVLVLLLSCEEYDSGINSPAQAVGFNLSNPQVQIEENDPVYQLEASTTEPFNEDVTLNFFVNTESEDPTNTANEEDYETNGSITIPAGSLKGSTPIDFNYDNLTIGQTETLVFTLDTVDINYRLNMSKITTAIEYQQACELNQVAINITFDNYPEETYWELYYISESSDPVLVAGQEAEYYAEETSAEEILNICSGSYTLVFYDSYGDGFCCGQNGDGSFSVTLPDGTVIEGNAQFSSSTSVNFSV